MLPIRVLDPARLEIREALQHYREIDPDLSRRMAVELRDKVRYARGFPEAGHLEQGLPVSFAVRRFLLKKFEFALYIAQLADELVLVAVSHQRQQPRYWADRLLKIER